IVLVDVPITGNRDFRLIADLPDGALKVRLSESSPMVTNDGPLWASLIGDQVKIDRLVASARGQRLATCGKLNLSGRVALDVAGSLELGQITGLDKVVSDLEGRLITGGDGRAGGKDPFDGSCLMFSVQPDVRRELGTPQGFLRIQNNLSAPTFAGSVSFEGVRMIPRGFGREVTIDSGVMHLRKSKGLQGAVELEIPSDAPLRGTIDEGAFQLTGLAKLPPVATREQLQHWLPDTGYINFSGTDLYWAEPKEYRVVLDPKLRMRFANVWQPDEEEDMRLRSSNSEPRPDPSLSLSGTISVPEGSYFESCTLLARSIGSVLQRREVDGPSKSITKSFPLLQRLKFDDFKVSGQNLVVQSDFGVGKTDLDTRFNFDVRGTLEDPRLFGFLDVTDGTLTYSVFRRVFEVTRGRVDFFGPATRPKLDILAETSIEAPRAGAGRQDDEFEDYSVQVAVTGRIPDYKLTLSSKPTLPEIDVQYLILLGKTKQQLSDEGFGQSSLELVSADIGSLVSQWIEAPFLDEVRVQPTVGGGGRIEAILRLGRSIRIGLVGRQEGGVTSYDARFRQKIRDNLLLEAIRRGRGEDNRERQRYEVQLKYTIPVD
ncbi:MAG: translocation/assembly module TamB domain-containing protein, partial [Myxococcota bacterium]|nr:translocation/assembly module TamB domain-containing protein [Myxococcota bacterium]